MAARYVFKAGNMRPRSAGAIAPSRSSAKGSCGSLARSPMPSVPLKIAIVELCVDSCTSLNSSAVESMSSVPSTARLMPHRSRPRMLNGNDKSVPQLKNLCSRRSSSSSSMYAKSSPGNGFTPAVVYSPCDLSKAMLSISMLHGMAGGADAWVAGCAAVG